jgi:alkyl hydroperoxide reductase subunit F
MYDLIIVGGGPAGLTAAIYAIRRHLNVFLVSQDLGGKTNYRMRLPDVKEYQVISGLEVVEKFWQELDYLEFARHLEVVSAVDKKGELFVVHTEDGQELQARSVIIATGSRVRRLDVPGEKEFFGRGLTYSAVSYAPLFLDRRAVVIGDGELALRALTELAQLAETVHLVTLTPDVLDTPLVKRLATNLKIVLWQGYEVKEIRGDEYARQVVVETPEGVSATLDTDGVFVELDLIPNSEPVQGLAELDEKGRIKIDRLNRTNCPGLFAAGDVTDAFAEQVVIAVGEGAKAALSAYDYLLPAL